MASRSYFFGIFLVIYLAVSILPQESNAALDSAKKTANQLSARDKPLRKLGSRTVASDLIFFDDEDKLMSNDDPFASSGDGPGLEEIEPTDPPQEEPEMPKTDAPEEESSLSPFEPETDTGDWNSVWPDHHDNETLPEETLPDEYLPIETCGKQQYYCKYGHRGPCHRNEIFTSLIDDFDMFRRPTCSSSLRWDHCLSSFGHSYSAMNRPAGSCRVRFQSRPCYGYPSNYRYCKQTRRCYPTRMTAVATNDWKYDFGGPCSIDQVFTAVDGKFGQCACKRPNYIYCKKTRRCYAAYTRASCSKGEWLVPSRHGSVCRPCPCPSMADGHHIFWSGRGRHYGRPGCYKSFTRGPCRPGMYFRIDNFATGSWRCMPKSRNNRMGLYSLIRDWQLLNNDMSLAGPVISNDFLDYAYENPWF